VGGGGGGVNRVTRFQVFMAVSFTTLGKGEECHGKKHSVRY